MIERKIILPKDFNPGETEWARYLMDNVGTRSLLTKVLEAQDKNPTLTMATGIPAAPTLTYESLMASITQFKEKMRTMEAPLAPRIHISELAITTSNKPKRVHVRRWYHTKKYHLKKQKELNDQYGFVAVPSVFYVNPNVQYERGFQSVHHQQPYYVVHPQLYEELKAQLDSYGKANLETLVNKF